MLGEPARLAESGDFGSCVFRCNQEAKALFRMLAPIPGIGGGVVWSVLVICLCRRGDFPSAK